MEVSKIATLNINGLTSRTRVGTLEGLIRQQDIDILFLQEVTNPDLDAMRGYTTHYNGGTSMRGTAIVMRDEITLDYITKITSDQAMAAEFRGIWLIHIYAPSGAQSRHERERFYNSEMACLLRTAQTKIILWGILTVSWRKRTQRDIINTTEHWPDWSKVSRLGIHGKQTPDARSIHTIHRLVRRE